MRKTIAPVILGIQRPFFWPRMSALQCEVTCAKVLLLEFCRVGHCWDLPGRVVLKMMGLGFE